MAVFYKKKMGKRKGIPRKRPQQQQPTNNPVTSKRVASKASATRGRTRFAGIINQGATCFLNAILQNLCLMPEFREAIFQVDLCELWGGEESILVQLQRLFASLMLENQKAVSSVALTNSLGWTREQVTEQQDAHEMFSILLPTLSSSLVGTSAENLISRLMTLTTVTSTLCEGCCNTSRTEAKETTLFLQVRGTTNGLDEAMYSSFCHSEILSGQNKFSCDVCGAKRNAVKTVKIKSAPQLLTVALNRVGYSENHAPYKVEDNFPFPLEVDLTPYTEDGQPDPDLAYELTGVIVHCGRGVERGHYTTYIRDIDSIGHWEMGFLKTNNSVFLVEGESVQLAEMQSPISSASNSTRDQCSPSTQQVTGPGQRWFLFDDENVTPATPEDLKSLYGGWQSAYMLLYRRRDCPRPLEAFGNPAYNIPHHLLEEMRQVNKNLDEERGIHTQKTGDRPDGEEGKKKEIQQDLQVKNDLLMAGCEPLSQNFSFDDALGDLRAIISTVDDEPVAMGVESEPLTLQLKEDDLSPAAAAVTPHTFPKNMTTLTELQDQVSSQLTGSIHSHHFKFGLG